MVFGWETKQPLNKHHRLNVANCNTRLCMYLFMCLFECAFLRAAKSACRSCRSYYMHVDLFLFLIYTVYIKNKNIFCVVRYMVNVWMRFLLQWLLSVEIQKRNAVLMTYRCIPDRTLLSLLACVCDTPWCIDSKRLRYTSVLHYNPSFAGVFLSAALSQCLKQKNTWYNSPFNTTHVTIHHTIQFTGSAPTIHHTLDITEIIHYTMHNTIHNLWTNNQCNTKYSTIQKYTI